MITNTISTRELNTPNPQGQGFNVGASIIRIGFWGSLYYTRNKEPPKIKHL